MDWSGIKLYKSVTKTTLSSTVSSPNYNLPILGTLLLWPKELLWASLLRTLYDTLIVMLEKWQLNEEIVSLFRLRSCVSLLIQSPIAFNNFLYSQNLDFVQILFHIFKKKLILLLTNIWDLFLLHYTYKWSKREPSFVGKGRKQWYIEQKQHDF